MTEKSKRVENISGHDFSEIMSGLTDEELVKALKKRNLYQPEAARSAMDEAIKRGLIHSEDDLLSETYKTQPLKTGLFPEIENDQVREKIRKSISRSLLIAGVLPIVFGVVRINSGNINEGISALIFGLVWLGLSFRLLKNHSKTIIYILLALTGASLFYTVHLSGSQAVFNLIDKITIGFFYLLLIYGILFLLRLKS